MGCKAKAKVRTRFGADFRVGLEATDTAVETRRLGIKLATQFCRNPRGQRFNRISVDVVSLQQTLPAVRCWPDQSRYAL